MPERKPREQIEKFIDETVQNAPRFEPPPFFAARVVNLVRNEEFSLAASVQFISRRLVPVLAMLMIVTSVLIIRTAQTEEAISEYELILDQNSEADEITIETVLSSIGPLSR